MGITMNENQIRIYVTLNMKEPNDCMEYLNGLENNDGTYNQKDVECFLNR